MFYCPLQSICYISTKYNIHISSHRYVYIIYSSINIFIYSSFLLLIYSSSHSFILSSIHPFILSSIDLSIYCLSLNAEIKVVQLEICSLNTIIIRESVQSVLCKYSKKNLTLNPSFKIINTKQIQTADRFSLNLYIQLFIKP